VERAGDGHDDFEEDEAESLSGSEITTAEITTNYVKYSEERYFEGDGNHLRTG
jgi:hypothetical protein